MNARQSAILIQMGSDERIPRAALGYIDDLGHNPSATVRQDRLAMLARYAPELCREFTTTDPED